MTRGFTLIVEKNGNGNWRLRCPASEQTVNARSFRNKQEALSWCRRHHYSVMNPVGPRDPDLLEGRTNIGF